jgi:hypothetical protein
MDFEKNTMTLLLSSCDDMDLFSDTLLVPVPIDIRLSLYQNITELHQNRKQMLAKVERTQQAVVVAVEAANRAAEKKNQVCAREQRKKFQLNKSTYVFVCPTNRMRSLLVVRLVYQLGFVLCGKLFGLKNSTGIETFS